MSRTDLIDAFNILFGPDYVTGSTGFLANLRSSDLKAAYRKKVLETHPDRSRLLGKIEADMNETFSKVNLAYKKLSLAIRYNSPFSFAHYTGHHGEIEEFDDVFFRVKCQENLPDHFYRGPIPRRQLLIGQFLYFSGLISLRMLFEALLWEKTQGLDPPPLLIALRRGFLSLHEIRRIQVERILERSYQEDLVEYAWRKGYINAFQRMALAGKRQGMKRPFGEYFVRKGILSDQELSLVIEKLHFHNRAFY